MVQRRAAQFERLGHVLDRGLPIPFPLEDLRRTRQDFLADQFPARRALRLAGRFHAACLPAWPTPLKRIRQSCRILQCARSIFDTDVENSFDMTNCEVLCSRIAEL